MPALATARFEICERLNERALRLDRENDKGLQRWKRENIYIYNFSLISQILKYHFTYMCVRIRGAINEIEFEDSSVRFECRQRKLLIDRRTMISSTVISYFVMKCKQV